METNKILTYSLISLAGIAAIVGGIFGVRYIINSQKTSGTGKDKNTGSDTYDDYSDYSDTSTDTEPTTTTSNEYYGGEAGKPTNREIILMGDATISWDRLYVLGAKLGLSKVQVNAIVTAGRPTFAIIAVKYPDWRTLIQEICADFGITFKATPNFTGGKKLYLTFSRC